MLDIKQPFFMCFMQDCVVGTVCMFVWHAKQKHTRNLIELVSV
jgi:hypothetical protein